MAFCHQSIAALPDLIPVAVDISNTVVDPQTLAMSGYATVYALNSGQTDIADNYTITMFEDTDFNEHLDRQKDNILGHERVGISHVADDTIAVEIQLDGTQSFKGNLLFAFIDSENEIPEYSESNNVANSMATCTSEFPIGMFNPVLEWHWGGSEVESSANQVVCTPVVGQLTDDNGDGSIDENDIPDIVFASHEYPGHPNKGPIRAISGDGTREHFTYSEYKAAGSAHPALGDIDNDGLNEIVYIDNTFKRIIALENDGTLKWRSVYLEIPRGAGTAVALADIDSDGIVEIIVGKIVLNNNGAIKWIGGHNRDLSDYFAQGNSCIADLDLDGFSEIIAANVAYRADGTLYWKNNAIPEVFAAVANFDDDPYPEIISAGEGQVFMLEHTGEIIWGPVYFPHGGYCGPPVIADFDGDNKPEIGISVLIRYIVYESDGTEKWTNNISDVSSGRVGSSVFDFEGDGIAEVVLTDEYFLRIYNGTNGDTLLEIPMGSSTGSEYPVIADVDNDNNAEIITVANFFQRSNGGNMINNGIYVFGDSSDTWVNTRKIWNQHSYSITNINDDGTIPQFPDNSWATYNNYRQNQIVNPRNCIDLTASYIRLNANANPDSSEIIARVGNGGVLHIAAGLNVAFYDGNPQDGGTLIAVKQTESRLNPGKSEDVSIFVDSSLKGFHTFYISADDDGSGNGKVSENDETNNACIASFYLFNNQPIITSNPPLNGAEGSVFLYEISAVDEDNDTLVYRLVDFPQGMIIDSVRWIIEWTPSGMQAGTHEVLLQVSDNRGGIDNQNFAVTVEEAINIYPEIVSSPPLTATEGSQYEYYMNVFDADGDTMQFALTVAPGGMTIDSLTGLLTWVPSSTQAGNHTVTVSIKDGRGGIAEQQFTIVVTESLNEAPSIITSPATEAVEAEEYTYDLDAMDPDNDSVLFTLLVSPANMSIDSISGLITWVPSYEQVGANQVIVEASDGREGVDIQDFTIDVIPNTNEKPVFVSTPVLTATQNQIYSYQATAEDPENEVLTYFLVDGPLGITVKLDGLVEWEPSNEQVGDNEVIIAVTDELYVVKQSFTITVEKVNDAPFITSNPLDTAVFGALYQYRVQAIDPDGDVLSYCLLTAPQGMVVSSDGLITWPDDGSRVDGEAVSIQVQDQFGAADTQSWTVAFIPDSVPPAVNILLSQNPVRPGTEVIIAVQAVDNVAIDFVECMVDSEFIVLDSNYLSMLQTIEEDTFDIIARAVDINGFEGTSATRLFVSNLVDDSAPEVTVTYTPEQPFVGDIVTFTVQVTDDQMVDNEMIRLNIDGVYIPVENGTAQYTAIKRGVFEIAATAYDMAGNYGEAADALTVSITGVDETAPTCTISSPEIDSVISGQVDIIGTAWDENFAYYTLSYRHLNESRFTEYARHYAPVQNGILGQFDATILQNGDYEVKVVVYDVYGNLTQSSIRLRAHGMKKISRFALAFDDMSIALPGMNLAVVRHYDSRIKTKGDFGYGWSVDLRSIRLTENRNQGEDWYIYDASGWRWLGSHVPNYVLDPDHDHTVSIAIPGGRTQVFDARAHFYNTYDPSYGYMTYEPRPSSYSTLENLDAGDFVVYNGMLYSMDNRLTPYNPDKYKLTLIDGTYYIIDQNRGGVIEMGDTNGNKVNLTPAGLSHSSGGDISFTRDTQGRITSIADGSGRVVNYMYDGHGNLQKVIDPEGNTTRFKYAPDHYLLEIIDPRGVRATRTEYDNDGRMVRQINPAGDTLYFDHLTDENIEVTQDFNGHVTEYEYDDRGNVTRKTDDAYNSWYYEYDSQGRMVARIDALNRRTGYVLDARGQTVAEVDPDGDSTKYAFDNNGNQVMTVNALGDTTRSTYNVFDKVATQTDALGNVTRFEYDLFGQLKKTIAPCPDALEGDCATYTQRTYDGQGNVKTSTDEMGRVTTFEYDHENRLVKTIFPDGSFTEVEYDSRGRRTASMDRNGNRTEYDYDEVGNNTVVRDALGQETVYEYDQSNRRTAMVDALGQRTEYLYDDHDRLVRTTFADGTYKTVTYDDAGRKIAETDQEGNTTAFAYDSVGNLTSVTGAMGYVTNYAYDSNNNRISQTDANNHTTTLAYDKLNRLVRRTYPNGDQEHFVFDPNGNQIAKVDGEGDSTVFTFDSRNRETMRRYTNSGHIVETRYTADGKPDTVIDHRGMTVYTYDNRGRQASVTNPDGSYIRSHFDPQGNRIAQVTAFDSVAYGYDQLNRMSLVEAASGTTQYFFNAVGNRDSLVNPNGTNVGYHYDNLNRLTNVTNYAPDGSTISNYTYTLNNAGIRTAVTEADGSRVDFGYDDTYKLTSETRTGSHAYEIGYTYDPVGNRLTKTDSTGTTNYIYSNRDQLISETSPSGTITQTYDL
ncbi:MAG: hypothetical protein GF350_07125, partial [Chitinivibrionales bacterium]|nr:hypothetical protein [Chitinivibrionales bacterium]